MTVTSRLARGSGIFVASLLAGAIQCASAVAAESPVTSPPVFADQQVSDAYIYLLGRLLVMRQQQLDFQEGMTWNHLVHRKPGAVDWPNPNLDVAYSEAWVAVDEHSCTQVSVPKITDRYYTVQLLNGWGETLANINERAFADHPDGEFAVCLKGAKVDLPANTRRIDLPVRTARVLSRVELGSDWNVAERLQHQFSMRPTGTPQLPPVPKAPIFELYKLPTVEAFDTASVALEEPDLNPGMQTLQAQVRGIAEQIKQPGERARIDQQIKTHAFANLASAASTIGPGTLRDGWVRPATSGAYGSDYLTRTLIDLGGIWANTSAEVNYYRGARDADGKVLDGGHSYSLTFPREQLPSGFARYFWSVTATNSKTFRVLPNSLDRFLLNNQSDLHYNADGSLTLYFGPQLPPGAAQNNWLPTVAGEPFRLMLRYYGAKGPVASGEYFPPALVRL
ncbi:DUF1254 domain-containing protein [Pseudomonas sp. C1C7]|uniref:DUF1214 domain-containing protein n=1 Tax=Pseudomonas putida TaxID=303 RepID=A0A2Z4RFJ8_PSEPU|nr:MULTISPECIES: DUF1214 domain-containing protein [Pseudomonas]AWY39108.1 DUF1214 domain-containing protein [Pseudomonas putida]NUT74864.1 DUF1254 domain-containing protein [Pseudomonas sp. C1C7]